MTELARQACAGDGSIELARGVKLFEEVFRRLSLAAMRRRTRPRAKPLDISAIVRKVLDEDLEAARRTDV
eukprot:4410998-Pleurochrysis_carterae.AAC.1